jgi:hypothetical protein
MADDTRVSQLAETVKATQENQKKFQKFVQESIKETQESMRVTQESMKASHRQFQEAQKSNLKMQKHLQDSQSRAIEDMQLQFKDFAEDMKKLVKFKSLILDNDFSRDNVESWVPESSGGGGRNPQPRQMRLDLHRFDGENPSNWIYKANQFFDYYQIPENQRVHLASFHMEGDALIWFQDGEDCGMFPCWDAFAKELQIRFGPSAYDDPMESMMRLKQTSIVVVYKTQFESLSNRLRG